MLARSSSAVSWSAESCPASPQRGPGALVPGAGAGRRAPGAAGCGPRRCPGSRRIVVRLARAGRLALRFALLPAAPGQVIDVRGHHPVQAWPGARAARLLVPVVFLIRRARWARGHVAVPRSALELPDPGRPGFLWFVSGLAGSAPGSGTSPHGPRACGGRPGGPNRVLAPAFREFFADTVPEIVPGRVAGHGTAQFLGPGADPFTLRGQPERLGVLPSRGLVPLLLPSRRFPPGGLTVAPLEPGPVTTGGLACPRFACRGLTARPRPSGAATAARVPAATAARRRDPLGRYRGGPPGGATIGGGAGRRFPLPCGEITLLFAVTPVALAPAATAVPPTRSPAACQHRNRPGLGRLSGSPARLSALRCACALPEKLSPPEQDPGGESDRREDAYGDRKVDQAQVGRGHPSDEYRHRHCGEEGARAGSTRPPIARRRRRAIR